MARACAEDSIEGDYAVTVDECLGPVLVDMARAGELPAPLTVPRLFLLVAGRIRRCQSLLTPRVPRRRYRRTAPATWGRPLVPVVAEFRLPEDV